MMMIMMMMMKKKSRTIWATYDHRRTNPERSPSFTTSPLFLSDFRSLFIHPYLSLSSLSLSSLSLSSLSLSSPLSLVLSLSRSLSLSLSLGLWLWPPSEKDVCSVLWLNAIFHWNHDLFSTTHNFAEDQRKTANYEFPSTKLWFTIRQSWFIFYKAVIYFLQSCDLLHAFKQHSSKDQATFK